MTSLLSRCFCCILISAIVGCSVTFNSSQYEFVRDLLDFGKADKSAPEASWEIRLQDASVKVFPVNVGTEVWFSGDNGLIVKFNGWQVTEAIYLLPNSGSISIGIEKLQMTFEAEREMLGSFLCANWESLKLADNSTLFRQDCGNGSEDFVNEIKVDISGSISSLRFKVHPDYPRILLEPVLK